MGLKHKLNIIIDCCASQNLSKAQLYTSVYDSPTHNQIIYIILSHKQIRTVGPQNNHLKSPIYSKCPKYIAYTLC